MFSAKKILMTSNSGLFDLYASVVDQFTGEIISFSGEKKSGLAGRLPTGIDISAELGEVKITAADYGFKISAPYPTKNYKIFVSASGYYSRETFVKTPGSKEQSSPENTLKVALIPNSFPMTAFDYMTRGNPNSGLMKRVSTSGIYGVSISRKILSFKGTSTTIIQEGQIGSSLSGLESKKSLLAESLTKTTPWTYSVGSGVREFEPFVGQNLLPVSGRGVLVAFYSGLRASSGARGWGLWRVSGRQVTVGHAMVDTGSPTSTFLHEVGHGFGYNHVGGTGSIMNTPSSYSEPTDFDIKSGKILFTRSLDNRDVDRDDWKYTLGYNYPDWIEDQQASSLKVAGEYGEDEIFDFTIGCFEDGTESLHIHKVFKDGSRVRIGGYERRMVQSPS